jgi:hypothetical protein
MAMVVRRKRLMERILAMMSNALALGSVEIWPAKLL